MIRTRATVGRLAGPAVVFVALLAFPGVLPAQTIDSRDTRTFRDERGQDTRARPGPIPPHAAELMKRIQKDAAAEKGESDESGARQERRDETNPAPGEPKRPTDEPQR
ncbi:hypothetical protein [Candidatus Nitrospira bockiana]